MSDTTPQGRRSKRSGPRLDHRQVVASRAFVDEGIADLLEAVWDYGLETDISCQGGQVDSLNRSMFTGDGCSDAWIIFGDIADGIHFLMHSMELLEDQVHNYDRVGQELPWAGSVALQIFTPFEDGDFSSPWRGRVVWDHRLTGVLTQVWVAVVDND